MGKSGSTNTNTPSQSKFKNFYNNHQFFMGVIASLVASAIPWTLIFIFKIPKIISTIESIPSIEETISTLQSDVLETQKTVDDIQLFTEKDTTSELTNLLELTKEDYNTGLASLNSELVSLSSSLNELKESTTKDIKEIEQSIEGINNKLFTIAMQLSPTENGINSIIGMYESIKNEEFPNKLSFRSPDIYAIDSATNLTYTSDELAEQKILLSYKIDDQEVFFYGQFNDKNQWDGNCIINIYTNNCLSLITDAEYDNGTLLSYKQAFPFTTNIGNKVWSISEREHKGNINCGESWNYYKQNEYIKNFTYNNVSPINIININEFKSSITTSLEGYYNGHTSNGNYNDDTGNAYMIKYFEDGTIRTLYVGNFANGNFCDNTGKAWYITKDINTTYMYYKGNFDMAALPVHDEGSYFENYLSNERINEILKENNFNITDIELNWVKYEE